ncbi:MAG: ABC transporter substrate-binding protein [Chloroflexi bacterium]|nr:ABC transporter substrate-binding protein [Chloroflexota bacterium]
MARSSLGNEDKDCITTRAGADVPQIEPIHDKLVQWGAAGEVEPQIAESWKTTDGTRWEFKLRGGVKFHNGEPVDAAAWKLGYERKVGPESLSPGELPRMVKNAEVLGDLAIAFNLNYSDFFPDTVGAICASPPKYLAQVGEKEYIEKPIGTGPFKLVKHVRAERFVFQAFESYYDKARAARVAEMVQLMAPEQSTRVAMLRTGEVDIADYMEGPPVVELGRDPNIRVLYNKYAYTYLISFNIWWPEVKASGPSPLNDVRVRRALSLALDRQALVDKILLGAGDACPQEGAFPYHAAWESNLPCPEYNPDKARQLLKEAGYDKLELGFQYIAVELRPVMEALQGYWEKVGVKAPLFPTERVAHYGTYRAHKTQPLVQLGVPGYIRDPLSYQRTVHQCDSWPSAYCSEEVDRIIAEGRKQIDLAKRVEYARRADKIARDEMAHIPLLYTHAVYGVGNRVKSYVPGPGNPYLTWLHTIELK